MWRGRTRNCCQRDKRSEAKVKRTEVASRRAAHLVRRTVRRRKEWRDRRKEVV